MGYFDPEKCPIEKFRHWIRFLNKHSIIKDALTLNAPLKIDPLRLVCTNSVVSNDVVTFIILDKHCRIDESLVCKALNFSNGNFVNLPYDQDLMSFFSNINYQGVVDLTKLSKSNLVNEWDCFFDTLAKFLLIVLKQVFTISRLYFSTLALSWLIFKELIFSANLECNGQKNYLC